MSLHHKTITKLLKTTKIGETVRKSFELRNEFYPDESLHCFFIASGVFLEEKRGVGEKRGRKKNLR